ncbi:MAG: hypothetical protein ABIG39_06425 [Candidatus Micrarchaeota archaeon]
MRIFAIMLVIAVLFSPCFSEARELPAILSDFTQETLVVMNCKTTQPGGSEMVDISINVDNPLPVQMKVSFTYLDMATGLYEEQPINQYCYIGPHLSLPCKFKMPIRLGGRANGTISNAELMRLKGVDPQGTRTETYTKSFWFNIEHEESLPEINAMNKIVAAEELISETDSGIPCFGSVCCGMGGANDNIELAKLDVSKAKEQLRLCNITGAYSLASSAVAKAQNAGSYLSSNTLPCTDILLEYKEAKTAVDEAEAHLSNLDCDVDQTLTEALSNARGKLMNSKSKIGSDEYELASLEIQGARNAAESIKEAGCTPDGKIDTSNGTDSNVTSGDGVSSEDDAKPCPAFLLPLILAAFAYTKR